MGDCFQMCSDVKILLYFLSPVQSVNMSHRGPFTTVITVLSAALGGLLIWQVYRTKRKKLSSIQKAAVQLAPLCPVEDATESQQIQGQCVAEEEFKTTECQTTKVPPPVCIPSCEQLLAVKPVMVSSREEWQEMWPLMQTELSVFPVLGLDCEWVKTEGVRNTFCMICFTQSKKGKTHPGKKIIFLCT